ncbi:MAG TPA: PIN domain-containing protein [Thermoanaerobaculia bacterium]|nr:PIN domain-containing protein [Thermoanaerobaculia bacterium]
MVGQSRRAAKGRRLISADTSSLRRFFEGEPGPDTAAVEAALEAGELRVVPVVVLELLSDPLLPARYLAPIRALLPLPLLDGVWDRAGLLRAELRRRALKAGVPDVLIAQSCIDANIPLITYDRHFRHFEIAGLQLV